MDGLAHFCNGKELYTEQENVYNRMEPTLKELQ